MYFIDKKSPREKNITKRQEWLCHLTVLSGYFCILINLIALVGVWAWIARPAHLPYSTNYYWIHYIISPTLVLLVVVGAVDLFVKNKRVPLAVKQYSVILLLVFCFAFTFVVHKIALVLLASFAIPVFVSAIFSKPKMTRNIYLISFVITIVCAVLVIPDITPRIDAGYLWVELVSALAILSVSFVFSNILIRNTLENLAELKISYETQSKMHSLMQFDRFTGLNNRSTFDEFLVACIEESSRTKETFSLVLIDLDHFKSVNDSYGHAKGDEVLLFFSQLLKNLENQDVYAFRFGGDEFALLCKYRDSSCLQVECERLRLQYSKETPEALGLSITFSCGIASFNECYKDAISFFNAADQALYLAKQQGRNRTVLADDCTNDKG